jgi:hypothetical protein
MIRIVRLPGVLMVLGLLAWAGVASAEPLYRLPSLREDRGIQVGAFKMWPEFFVETRYDTNLFRRADKDTGDKVGATIFRFMPAFEVSNPLGRLVRFHFAGMGDLRAYYASKNSEIVKAQAKYGGNARARVHVLPEGVFQFYAQDRFNRELQTRNEVSKETFTRMFNEALAGVILQPASALSFDANYAFVRDVFEELPIADKTEHVIALTGRWQFFPRTEAFVKGGVAFTSYDEVREVGGLQIGNFPSSPVRVEGGLNGYLTRRIFVTLSGGYGGSFHEKGASYSGFIAKAMVGYELPGSLVVQGGYSRSFEDSLFANYFSSDALEAWAQLRLWQMVDLDLGAKYLFVNYGSAIVRPGVNYSDPSRSDNVLVAKGGVSLNFLRYLGVNVGVQYTNVLTDFSTEVVASGDKDYGAFSKLEVFGNVVVRY